MSLESLVNLNGELNAARNSLLNASKRNDDDDDNLHRVVLADIRVCLFWRLGSLSCSVFEEQPKKMWSRRSLETEPKKNVCVNLRPEARPQIKRCKIKKPFKKKSHRIGQPPRPNSSSAPTMRNVEFLISQPASQQQTFILGRFSSSSLFC